MDLLACKASTQDIDILIAGTKAETTLDFENMLKSYAEIYWKEKPEVGKNIARELWRKGKIDQPRMRNEQIANLGSSHWCNEEGVRMQLTRGLEGEKIWTPTGEENLVLRLPIGYQIWNRDCNIQGEPETPGLDSYDVMDREVAEAALSFYGQKDWRLGMIFEGDIEEPSIVTEKEFSNGRGTIVRVTK